MAKFDEKKYQQELSDDQLAQISGGVAVDLAKAGLGSGTLNITPELVDFYDKQGQISSLIAMFGFVGSIYTDEIKALYAEYKGSKYTMPAELDAVLKQFI